MASHNLKFEELLEVLFGSLLKPEEIKTDILDYVKQLETNYNQKIS